MNQYFDRLMVNIPSGYDKDAHEKPALQLTGTGNLAIDGDILYVSTSSATKTIDLHGESVSSLVSQFPSGITVTVLQDGMAELLMLPYQSQASALPATLSLPANALWFIIGAMARSKESRKRSLLSQVAQINVAQAMGRILDWWGATLDVERYAGEPDSLFAQRMVSLKFAPNVNNIAIENILSKLGYMAVVDDGEPGTFSVDVTLPTSVSSGFSYTLENIQDTLQIAKAGGILATVVLQGLLSDTVTATDALQTAVLQSGWTPGNFTVGEFTV